MNLITKARSVFFLLLISGASTVSIAKTANEYFSNAQQFVSKKDWSSAIIELKNAVQQNPEYKEARVALGKAYLRVFDAQSAIKELERAKVLGANDKDYLIPLGEAMLQAGRANDFLQQYNVSDQQPVEVKADLLALRATAQFLLGKKDEAMATLKKASETKSDSPIVLLAKARVAFAEKDYDESLGLTNKLLNSQSDNEDAMLLQGEIYGAKTEYKQASASFQKVLRQNEKHPSALVGVIIAAMSQKDFTTADLYIEKTIRFHPQLLQPYLFKSQLALDRKQLATAEDALNKLFQIAPKHPLASFYMAMLKYEKGEYEQAKEHISVFNTKFPKNLAGLKLLSAVRLRVNENDKALESLKKAEEIDPEDGAVLQMLGSVYMRAGKTSEGTEYLEKAAAKSKDKGGAIKTQLGLSYLAKGDIDEAVTALESAVNLDSKNKKDSPADELLVLAYLGDKQVQKADQLVEKILKEKPNDPLTHFLKGRVFIAKNDMTNARKSFEKSLSTKSDYYASALVLAELDQREGNISQARTRYESILAKDPNQFRATVLLAELERKAGNQAKAVTVLEKANQKNPNSIAPAIALAQMHLALNAPLKAVDVARTALTTNKDNPQLLAVLGSAQLANKESASAASTFKKLAEKLPTKAQPQGLIGQAYLAADDQRGAERAFREAVRIDEKYLPGWLGLVQVYGKQKDDKRIAEIAEKLKKVFPSEGAGWELEGDQFLRAKNKDKAQKSYDIAYSKSPRISLLFKSADLMADRGDSAGSEKAYRNWLKSNPNDSVVRSHLAQVLQNSNQYDKALSEYELILKQKPDEVVALNNASWLYTQRGDKRGITYAERALQSSKNSPMIADTYAWALLKLGGDNQKALRLLKDAKTKVPHIKEIRYHYAYALKVNGDRAGAKQELQEILSSADVNFEGVKEAKALLSELK